MKKILFRNIIFVMLMLFSNSATMGQVSKTEILIEKHVEKLKKYLLGWL